MKAPIDPPGYTLFEMLLAVALIGMGLMVSLTPLQGMREHYALQGAADSVVSVLAAARLRALTSNRPIQLRVNGAQYALANSDQDPVLWHDLPRGVRFSRLPGKPPTFYSRGYAAPAGHYTLRNRSGGISIIIAASGRTRWERIP